VFIAFQVSLNHRMIFSIWPVFDSIP